MVLRIILAAAAVATGVGGLALHHRGKTQAARPLFALFVALCVLALALKLLKVI